MRTNIRRAVSILGLSAIMFVVVLGMTACQSGEQSGTQAETEQTSMETEGDQVTTYTCPMHPEVMSDEPGKCPECGMNLVEAGSEDATMDASETDMVMYTCPMHPEVQTHEPGECPDCGMDLVKMGSEGGE
jgi:hypothetical protein